MGKIQDTALYKETLRRVSMANKRKKRLEKNDLNNLPAYQSLEKLGIDRFSVKGKNKEELQREYWRVTEFLNNKTSTVKEANKYIKELGVRIGIKGTLKELKRQTEVFFKLQNRIDEYFKTIDKKYLALDYNLRWKNVDNMVYLKDLTLDLGDEYEDWQVDELLQKYISAIGDYGNLILDEKEEEKLEKRFKKLRR